MPCFELLGVRLCFPSLDEIAGAVLTPITSLITSGLQGLSDTLTPLFQNIIDSLSPFFQSVIDGVTGFVSTLISGARAVIDTIWTAIQGIPGFITGALEAIGSTIIETLSGVYMVLESAVNGAIEFIGSGLVSLGSEISTFISNGIDSVSTWISALGNQIVETVNGAGLVLEGVFTGALEGVGSAIGGLFEGFGSVDVNSVINSALGVGGFLTGAVGTLGSFFSPISPAEAEAFVQPFINQVTSAATLLHTSNMVVEGASLGQIDVGLQDAWRYPPTAAALTLATTMVTMPLVEGLLPAYKRYILSRYVPLIPPYADLIGIYVKEGYLPDHWVELPAEMVQNFRELGFSEYWTQRLWGKHWVYPGPSQLYEMLHRTTGSFPEIGVTEDVLRDMLKLHDFEPKWRGPLEDISWNTWRIYDIRTGWEMGILNDTQLLNRLIDTGYQPPDAAILLDIQKMFVLRTEIDRILTEADTDFIDGWISLEQLTTNYGATPYNEDVQELRIARAKLRQDREWKKDLLVYLRDLFIKRRITETEFTEELSKLGMVEIFISIEVARDKLKQKYVAPTVEKPPEPTKPLTESRVLRLYKAGVLNEAQTLERLQILEYSLEDAKLIMESEPLAEVA